MHGASPAQGPGGGAALGKRVSARRGSPKGATPEGRYNPVA